MTDKIIVYTTCSNPEEAKKVARHLVEQRLAACASFTPGATSLYRWQGAIEESTEVTVTIKSRRDLFARLSSEIRRVHSYEVPEILAVPVVDAEPSYLEWMDRELLSETGA